MPNSKHIAIIILVVLKYTQCTFLAGDEDIRVFVEEPKAYTADVGEMVRFTCVGIYPQVSYPDVCITFPPLYMCCC